jgi:hypothetical protein
MPSAVGDEALVAPGRSVPQVRQNSEPSGLAMLQLGQFTWSPLPPAPTERVSCATSKVLHITHPCPAGANQAYSEFPRSQKFFPK